MASDAFLEKGSEMSKRLGIYWPHLLMVMNLESGISPAAHNPGGASGLIQFTNLAGVGWSGTSEAFRALSDVDQLPYVERFLSFYKKDKLDSVRRIHQALYVPATLPEGSDPDLVLTRADGTRWGGREAQYYADNHSFDADNKGYITAGDLEKADIKAAAPASSGYQRAVKRLQELLPEYAKDVANVLAPPGSPARTVATSKSPWKTTVWWLLGATSVAGGAAWYLLRKN